MFTIEQIKAAHSKVKSGADFPAYIQEIKELGVVSYETFVADGHADYYGANNFKAGAPAKYAELPIKDSVDQQLFTVELKAHQQGKTDYKTFIEMCATAGVVKWSVKLHKMTCTYFDKAGNVVLEEVIPG
ncbi:MAG: DUF1398 family protein [Chitinophagales bacterium]